MWPLCQNGCCNLDHLSQQPHPWGPLEHLCPLHYDLKRTKKVFDFSQKIWTFFLVVCKIGSFAIFWGMAKNVFLSYKIDGFFLEFLTHCVLLLDWAHNLIIRYRRILWSRYAIWRHDTSVLWVESKIGTQSLRFVDTGRKNKNM